MGQVWGDYELPSLSHAHALQAGVQTFDHLVSPKSCLLGGIVVMTGGEGRGQCQHPLASQGIAELSGGGLAGNLESSGDTFLILPCPSGVV